MALLVTDITPWIDFFSGKESTLLETGLLAGSVAIPALVKAEILGNPLSAKDRKALEAAVDSLPSLGIDPAHFSRAGKLKAELEEKGFFISARDAHILQCAIDNQAILISNDPLFHRLQKSAGLRVEMW